MEALLEMAQDLLGAPLTMEQGKLRVRAKVTSIALAIGDVEEEEFQLRVQTKHGEHVLWLTPKDATVATRAFPFHRFRPDVPIHLVWRGESARMPIRPRGRTSSLAEPV